MINIDISRIRIALHGVSAQVAEAAVAGLGAELKRRLGVLPSGDLAAFDVGDLAIGPIRHESVLDASALRGLIADRLAGLIRDRLVGQIPAAGGDS